MSEQDPPWMCAAHRKYLAAKHDLKLQQCDVICKCGHWIEEHTVEGDLYSNGCGACECYGFKFDEYENTPEAIADRGGEHEEICACGCCRQNPKFKIARTMAHRKERYEDGNGVGKEGD